MLEFSFILAAMTKYLFQNIHEPLKEPDPLHLEKKFNFFRLDFWALMKCASVYIVDIEYYFISDWEAKVG